MKRYLTIKEFIFLVILAVFIFSFYIWIPVTFIPGNSLSFYFSITPHWTFVLLGILALEISFILVKSVAEILQKKNFSKGISGDIIMTIVSIFPSLLACPTLAVAALSSLLPITTIWSLAAYSQYILLFTVALATIAVWYRVKMTRKRLYR